MKLTLHMQAGLPGDSETAASVSGDTLTVNGVAYDLSPVPEGGEATPEGESPFVGAITRTNGEIHAAILWRYDSATAEPDQPPVHPVVTITSGDVPDPVLRKPEPEPEEGEPA
tara:strand:- start:816 stop:1154 length:339 start_codon:yes stop_codon:yes gene_type:complete